MKILGRILLYVYGLALLLVAGLGFLNMAVNEKYWSISLSNDPFCEDGFNVYDYVGRRVASIAVHPYDLVIIASAFLLCVSGYYIFKTAKPVFKYLFCAVAGLGSGVIFPDFGAQERVIQSIEAGRAGTVNNLLLSYDFDIMMSDFSHWVIFDFGFVCLAVLVLLFASDICNWITGIKKLDKTYIQNSAHD